MRKLAILPVLAGILFQVYSCAPAKKELPASTPEEEGISSEAILQFVNAAENSRNELHSFVLLRHGKVIAEGWWNPYRPDLKHTLYSTSKSFTSTAVGFAVHEKRISLSDRVISFFPEFVPDTVNPWLKELTIENLLTMSVGQDPEPTAAIVGKDSNWVKAFLATPIAVQPGTRFLYNSLATYMAGAIVQKVTGQTLLAYLTPRLFEPLGIEGADWETDPMGYNTGGWGLRLKTEDMAKFGLLYLQKGKWNGKQILPAGWVEEATKAHIMQYPETPQAQKDSSDWLQGYGYQFWRCRHHAFRADGAYGQFIIMMPEQDAVLAITAETPDMQDEINLVWKYLLPAFQPQKLPENPSALKRLREKLASLALPVPEKKALPETANAVSGRKYQLETNERNLEEVAFRFADTICYFTVKAGGREYEFPLGNGHWEYGETSKPGPNLLLGALGHFAGLPPARIAGAFTWPDNKTLEVTVRYIESPHREIYQFVFDGSTLSGNLRFSHMFDRVKWEFKGQSMQAEGSSK